MSENCLIHYIGSRPPIWMRIVSNSPSGSRRQVVGRRHSTLLLRCRKQLISEKVHKIFLKTIIDLEGQGVVRRIII